MKKLVLFIVLTAFGIQLASAQAKKISLNVDILASNLIGEWTSVLAYDNIPINLRRTTALNLYQFLFQYWLATEYQGEKFIFHKNTVKLIMKQVAGFVAMDDPMGLNKFYDDDNLTTEVANRVHLSPLLHTEGIFIHKQNYKEAVTKFNQWMEDKLK